MIDSEITLRKLEVLVAFVRHGSLARTAEALDLSTVSVHRALHSLEAGVRCPLFKHEGRSLRPLPSALLLAESAKDLLDGLGRALRESRDRAGFGGRHLRIGAMYSLTVEIVPKLVMGVKLRRPELDIELVLGSNAELLRKLADYQLDAILVSSPDEGVPDGIEVVPLFTDDIFLASAALPAALGAESADLVDYRHEPFVALADGFDTFKRFQEAFRIAGFEPQIIMRVGDIFSLMNLVAGGVGHTLLPGRVSSLFEGRIHMTPLAPRYRLRQTIALLFQKNEGRNPNVLALVAEARAVGRAYGPRLSAAPRPLALMRGLPGNV